MRIGIVVNKKKKEALKVFKKLDSWLKKEGKKTCNDLEFPRREVPAASDIIVAIGGDGTLLNIIHYMKRSIPILGVNAGGLGFLTATTPREALGVLEDVLKGNYEVSERMMLTARIIKRDKSSEDFTALNDVVITKNALSRIMKLELFIKERPVTSYMCDGLIISTPTGSTAHSLAAGGPIVYPEIDAFVVLPICPHTLSNRPLVVPGDSVVGARIGPGSESREVFVTIDGQEGIGLERSDFVEVRKKRIKAKLIRSPKRDYFKVLTEKLEWGRRRSSSYLGSI